MRDLSPISRLKNGWKFSVNNQSCKIRITTVGYGVCRRIVCFLTLFENRTKYIRDHSKAASGKNGVSFCILKAGLTDCRLLGLSLMVFRFATASSVFKG